MPLLEVKFRGDGAEYYKGKERRKKVSADGLVERLVDELQQSIEGAVHDDLVGNDSKRLGIHFKRVLCEETPSAGMDGNATRDNAMDKAVDRVASEIILRAVRIIPVKPTRRR